MQHFIGNCYLDGGDIIKKDIPEGLRWLLKAAQNVGNPMEQIQSQEKVLHAYREAHIDDPDLPSSPPITPEVEMEWILNSIILNQGGYWWTVYPSNQVAIFNVIQDSIAEQRDLAVQNALQEQLGLLELEKTATPETLAKVEQQVIKDVHTAQPKKIDHAKALETTQGSMKAALEKLAPGEAKGVLEMAFNCNVLFNPTDHSFEDRVKSIAAEFGNDVAAFNGNEDLLRIFTMLAKNENALNLLKENVDAAVVLNTAFVRKVAHLGYDDTVRLLDAIQTALLYFYRQKGH